jgi:hypothetical protein
MTAVASAESRIRKMRLSNINSSEARKFEKQIFSDLIRSCESNRLKEIKSTADALFKMQAVEPPIDFMSTSAELLNLQTLQLRHKWTDESSAMAALNGMERRGYDPAELLVLSAISKRTNTRAQEVREQLPPRLANPDGLKLIQKLESLLELRTGEVGYSLKSAPGSNEKVNVCDLLADVAPTMRDLELVK